MTICGVKHWLWCEIAPNPPYVVITDPWSNGQTEGQITRLKLVKRQMYRRANLDLTEIRLIGAA